MITYNGHTLRAEKWATLLGVPSTKFSEWVAQGLSMQECVDKAKQLYPLKNDTTTHG